MKVTYQTCCGVDVHKSFLVATIVKTTGGIEPSYQKKRFSTFNSSILEFKQWLLDNDCHDVCMESTGKYWVPVFNLLEDEINVVIANPKWVKAVKGNKDDTKDSKWIGDLFRLGLVKGSYIPCKIVRILREYTRYRYKLVSCRSSEKNRYQNALTVCNVALDSVVSDIFGKSSTSIIDYLLEQSGTSINHEEINDVDKMIENIISSNPDFENAVQFLCTIPGVKRDSAITIISEIGTDMSQFGGSKRLCCWAGLTPGSNESAGKKKSVRITRAEKCASCSFCTGNARSTDADQLLHSVCNRSGFCNHADHGTAGRYYWCEQTDSSSCIPVWRRTFQYFLADGRYRYHLWPGWNFPAEMV